jgi:D-glycero-alpha-D-manno-heptose-7-phosphate kinase
LIISRTPYRCSLLGGGSDYFEWFSGNSGAVLTFTINHYSWIFARHLPEFFEYKNIVRYRITEHTNTLDEIEHPVVGAVLKYFNQKNGWDITHCGDLPARSGVGSSSSFVVGLLNIIYHLDKEGNYLKTTMGGGLLKRILALESIHIERDVLYERGGYQDQIQVAYGGLNLIEFNEYDFKVEPVILPMQKLISLQEHLILCYTKNRNTTSSQIVTTFVDDLGKNEKIKRLEKFAHAGVQSITTGDMASLGKLLDESWSIKKTLSPATTTPTIDEIYAVALASGAYGGKLLGAGGGGFMLLCVPPHKRTRLLTALEPYSLVYVDFTIEFNGSEILFP